MTKEEANIEAKKVFEWYSKERERIEVQTKRDGIWHTIGLDSNQCLINPLMVEVKNKLSAIKEKIDEN